MEPLRAPAAAPAGRNGPHLKSIDNEPAEPGTPPPAGVALLLASLGIYGVVSHAVGRRTNEIGIRMALGAQPASVRNLVVREALLPLAAGAALGLAAAIALGGVLRGLLYQVNVIDPLTFAIVPVLLGIVAAAASWLPARRAARLDPLKALQRA